MYWHIQFSLQLYGSDYYHLHFIDEEIKAQQD